MEEWFRIRKYPHIGPPIELKEYRWVCDYVKNPANIKKHSFFPFLHRSVTQRRFRRGALPNGIPIDLRIPDKKIRPIMYASHLDSNVYSYYAFQLSQRYETILSQENIGDCATAYRKMKNKWGSGNCCSIDHAEEVFDFIRQKKDDKFYAITLDIQSFFDSLDHSILKKAWKKVIGAANLPEDHYKVFKQITSYSFCNEKRIFDEFKNSISVRGASGNIRKKRVARFEYLRGKNAVSFCTGEEFRKRIVGKKILLSNKKTCGIPQGSPISAVLANIYMLEFDKKVSDFCLGIKALYRRYSDDIVLVCDEKNKGDLLQYIQDCIKDLKLEIQPSKTQVYEFVSDAGILKCHKILGEKRSSKFRFEYLGFEFDGAKTYLKSASLAKFYRTMKHSLKRADFYSRRTQIIANRGKVFRTRLYKRFSYLGMHRRVKYIRDRTNPSVFHRSKFYDWGNYLSYAYKASRIMSLNRIMPQIRNHWKILNDIIIETELKFKIPKV